MLLKYWILLFYESLVVVLVILSVSEYPCYKFYSKTNTTLSVDDTEGFGSLTNTNSSG